MAYALARLERYSLSDGRLVTFQTAAGAAVVAVRALDMWQRRTEAIDDLDEGPAPATQRLGLSE
jgi:hypothetical protein